MNYFNNEYKKSGFAFGDKHSSLIEESIPMISFNNNNKKVLDLGVGDGVNAIYLAKCGLDVTGIDVAEEGLKKIATIANNQSLNITTHKDDLREINIENDFFIGIYCIMTLQFIVPKIERSRLIEKIKRGLAGKGIVCIKVKTVEDPQYQIDSKQYEYKKSEKNTFYSDQYHCNVYYFESGELLNYFRDLHVVLYREYKYLDNSHGTPHFHGVAEIIAEKI